MDSTIVSTRPHLPWIEKALYSGGFTEHIWHSSSIQVIGGDGFSVNLPAPLVLAFSPLLRSIVSNQHHCGTVSISVPSAEGCVLVHLAEILRKGETSVLFGNKYSGKILSSLQSMLDMLQCSVKMSQEIKVDFVNKRCEGAFEEDIYRNHVLSNTSIPVECFHS